MKLGMTPGVSALRKLIMRRPALKSDVGYFVCYKLLILLLSYALSPVCNSFLLSELDSRPGSFLSILRRVG